jgi:hypothetical protein
MHNRPSPRLVFAMCLTLAFLVSAAGCLTPTPPASPATTAGTTAPMPVEATEPPASAAATPVPQVTPSPLPTVPVTVEVAVATLSAPCPALIPAEETPAASTAKASDCFIDRQVLVTGLASFLTSEPKSLGGLTALQTIDLTELIQRAHDRNDGVVVPYFPQFDLGKDRLLSVLFEIPILDPRSVGEVIASLDEEAKVDSPDAPKAYADPNYLTGEPTEGFPNGVVGSPFGDAATAPDGFANQWAFKQIWLTSAAVAGASEEGGIPLGVFDTFPVPMTPDSVSGYTFQVRHGTDIKASLAMCVKRPVAHAEITPSRTITVADHGVFVAYLAQALAPHTRITLYRVLNEYGDGDQATLGRALSDFMKAEEGARSGVINLSLGIKSSGASCGSSIPSLQIIEGWDVILSLARQLGFVVVAAAGNSANNAAATPTVVPPDLPASSADVIGVAASNNGGNLACFSNFASNPNLILAPGGEGREVGQGRCKPPPGDDCSQTPNPCINESIISLMPSSSTGYGYWTGTSFAAPLVSGLAADCLEVNGGRWQDAAASEGVRTAISTRAVPTGSLTINGSVVTLTKINVPETLAECK